MSYLLLNLKNFFSLHLKQVLTLLAIVIFVLFCPHPTKPLSQWKVPSDQEWIKSFFKELLLEEGAIYTLWGSKPITRCVLYYYSEEELQDFYDQMSQEEKNASFIVEDSHFEENWEKWEKIQGQFPMEKYLLFKRANPEDAKTAFVYFVNILQTAIALRQHYSMFKEVIGHDFNPFDMACDFKNKDSPFWQKTFDHSALVGILFGFGAENSWAFQWKYYDHSKEHNNFAEAISLHPSDISRHGKSSLADFSLPIFVVIDGGSGIIERYKKERERIKALYKNQNFVEFTLQKMTSQSTE